MAKKWDEVAASEGFKALTPDQQDGARRQYFDQVVAPQVPPEQVDRAWDQFSTDVGVGRRALPKDVTPSRAGAGRGVAVPTQTEATPAKPKPAATETVYDPATGMPLGTQEAQAVDGRTVDERRTRAPGRLTDADIPDATAGSVARDIASGVLQIGPTAVKGVGELARLATGDRIGKGLADAMDRGTEAIQDTVGSERGGLQRQKFAQDMQDPALNAADVIFDNPGAISDQVLPTVGSMALPVGAAGAAGKLATSGRAAQLARAIDEGTVLARADRARQGAVAGTTVAQNAASTFSDIRDAGGELDAAYTGAAVTAPATYVANRLTGGGAEANAANLLAGTAKGAVKAIPKAMAKEGAQEAGEEAGGYVGETVGKGEEFDANAAGKRMAVAGTLGAVMGGGVEAAGAARAAREARIKTLRDAGETAAADLMQQKHDKATAAESVDAELNAMPGNEAFAQQYRTLRTAGVKPAEAAARSAVTVTFQGMAAETGLSDKAMAAALDKAQTLPLDKVPGFLHRYTEALAKRGLIQPVESMAAIGTSLETARDDAMEAAIGAAYQPVKATMDAVQALETEQNQGLAPVDSAQAATETIANVQDPTQATGPGTETQTTPGQAPATVGSDAAPAQGLPGAGGADLQTDGVVDTAVELDERAHAAATSPLNELPEPTQAQKEAGNYKVGRVNLQGLNISIENPQGSVRRGVGDDGKPWENELAAHYGYIRGTEGNDGDHVDTFIGPNPDSDRVFVVDQVNKDGSFDEHKIVLGANNLQQADNLYHDNYHEGWTGRGAITEMSMADFKKWVKDGTKTKPVGTLPKADAGAAPADGAAEVEPATGGAPAPADSPVYLGRDNTPLTEGGKAFKTRKAADDARKLNPMMRVVRADGGYALTEKTPAQLAAQEKAAKRLRNPQTSARGEPIPAHAMIAAAGGLAPDTRADMGMQGNVQIGNRKLFAGTGKGLTIERATERLVEEGYLPEGASHDQARDLIKRSLNNPQYTPEGTEQMAAAELEARRVAAIAEIEEASDNRFFEIDDADIPWGAEVSNTSTEAAMRALGFTDQEISDAIANESRIQGQDSQNGGQADESTATPAQADLGRRESPQGADPGGRSEARRQEATVEPQQTPAPAGVSTSGFDITQRPDGTLAVKGDAAAIREALKDIPAKSLAPMKGGILVGRTQADKAMAILQPAELTAPTKDDVLAQQERADKAAKDKAAADRAAEKKAAEGEDRKRIAKASEAAADTFELGGDAMANLTGQKDIFAEVPVGKQDPVKIEDAGEKIGGARKDKWKDRGLDLTDLDSMSEAEGAELATKANVWKPDYEAMAEAAEPVTAAMVKTVYDQLAAQPKKNTPEGRRNYVTMMQAVRKAYSEAKSPEDVKQAGDKLKRAIGLYTDNPEQKKQAREVLFSVYKGRSDPFVLGYSELSKAKKMVEDGFPAKGEPWKKRLSLRAYSATGFTPRGIEITREESAELGTPLTKEQIQAGFYRINAKDGKAVGYAPTKADAEATAKTIYERDLKKGPAEKAEPSRPNLDSLKREGLPKRTDRDVSADDFVKDFGFRGVEFGNWAAQDERQRIINMAYDGLMDLAEIMGVPPKALSLNGTMGMAFGARGGGKFAAHYEPGKLVINMTKINGGGSMAHEWAHALDHYFGELNQKDAYTTKARGASGWYDEQQYKGLPITRMEKDAQGKWANVTKLRLNNLRPEMSQAFDGVMSALFSGQETKAQMVRSEELAIERYQALADKETDADTKAMYLRGIESRKQYLEELRKDPEDKTYPKGRSAYAGEAQKLVGKSATGYWTRPTEMFARAFESWVFDKVAAMGARSDYLVHGVEEDRFAGGGYKGNPYPTGQERATINAAFDKLASTIKTKETDKGVAMFARGTNKAVTNPKDVVGKSLANPADDMITGAKPEPLDDGHDFKTAEGKFTSYYWDGDKRQGEVTVHKGKSGYTIRNINLPDSAQRKGIGSKIYAWVNQQSIDATGKPLQSTKPRTLLSGKKVLEISDAGKSLWKSLERKGLAKQNSDGSYTYNQPNESTAPDSGGASSLALGADAFRLGITPRKFMPVADVQKAVDQLTAKWKDGPRIKVVLSPEELPVDAPSDARGLIHKGTAYIVAGNHLDRMGVARTLGHEAIGHYGLWKMLGTDGTRQFERNVQLALKSGNKPLNAIAARVRELYVDEKGKFNLSPAEEANEIAAFAVEEALDADGNFKPGFGFMKQVWSKVVDFLRGLGFDIKFTNAELQGMLVSAMRGLEAGKRLEGGGETLVAAARDAGDLPEQNALREISGNDEMFQYPVSYMDTVEGITADIAPHIKVRKLTNIPGETRYVFETPDGNTQRMMVRPHNPYASEDAPTIYGYDLDANHEMTGIVTERPGKNPEYADGKDDVYVDVSLMRPGERGAAIYAIAANYANNTGKVFIGDPAGLSDHAMKRRVEQMLSSALKFGTTDHLAPHPRQVKGDMSIGVPALNWTYGDDLGNIKSLIRVSNAIYGNDNPITFEPVTGRYLDSEGVELDDDAIRSIARTGRGREVGAGLATVKRIAVLSALVSKGATGSDSARGRDQLLEKLLDVGREFPAATSRIFYARGVTPGLFAPTVWNTPDPTRTDRIIYELQDGRVDLKRVQEAIAKSGQQIEEKWDARLAETLYPGRVAHRSQQFLDAEVKPLLKSMATYGVQMDELADYLHARGAEERNAQVAKVNPDLPDGGAGKNTKGVLLTNQAAKDYLANMTPGRKQLLDKLATKVDAITNGTRTLLVAEGLEKQDTIDAWTKAYKNYVPMFRDEAQSGAPHPQGSGFSVKGSASKRATGSTKEVTNILAHVLMQREAAITRAEKNRVALALYGQALSHPNPDFWTTIKPSMSAAAIGKELQAMGVDPATAAAGMETVPTITTVDAATGKKVDRPNPLYRSLPGAIPLKVNGEDRVLMLNTEKERGARLAENLKNLDGLTKLDLANSIIGKGTRWLASVNTQYNPAFGLVNLTRDTLGAAVNLGSTQLRGNALKVMAKTPVAIYGIARELMQGGKSGKWSKLYRQFQEDGGQTGYKENFRDAGDRAKAIESELAGLQKAGKLTAAPGRVAHALLDLLDGFNTTLENAVRVSAYSAALDAGMSRAEAARLGRELTVDFNRKGRAGREVGPLYAFFNASVQGSARTVQALKGPTGAKIIAGGLALGALQTLMLLAAGYDDDEIPEFVKTRALVIPLNWTGEGEKKHVLVPYPLGLHVIPNTGRVLSELALNGGKDLAKSTGGAIGEIAGAFNPLGGGNIFTTDGFLKTIAPTLVDPVIELGYNRNFAGKSIEREAFNGETDTRPGVARAKEATQRSTTGQAYMGISKAINSMTGGNDYEAGAVSPTPERVRYLAQTVGGGVLREIEKTINASTAASRGEDVKSSAIPVLGRFYGEVDESDVTKRRYYQSSERIGKLADTVKHLDNADQFDVLDAFEKANPATQLETDLSRAKAAIAKLNKLAVQSVGSQKEMAEIDEDRLEEMRDLNDAVAEMEKQTQKPTLSDKIKGWRKEAVTP